VIRGGKKVLRRAKISEGGGRKCLRARLLTGGQKEEKGVVKVKGGGKALRKQECFPGFHVTLGDQGKKSFSVETETWGRTINVRRGKGGTGGGRQEKSLCNRTVSILLASLTVRDGGMEKKERG